jgi:hypothetical protein
MYVAGNLRYERQQGDSIWKRVEARSDFDVVDAAS